ADVDRGSCDETLHLLLRLAAEAAFQQLATLTESGHISSYLVGGYCRELAAGEYSVDDSILLGLVGEHPVITLRVGGHLLHRLAGVLGEDLVELLTHLHDEPGLDLDVGGLALGPAMRLVQHDAGVREGVPLAGGSAGEDHRGGRSGHAHADGGHVRADVLHRVVDGGTEEDDAVLEQPTVDVEVALASAGLFED